MKREYNENKRVDADSIEKEIKLFEKDESKIKVDQIY